MKHTIRSSILANQKDPVIKIELWKDGDRHEITVDGVAWTETENPVHAAVLYELLRDHLAEYMTYRRK